MIITNNENLPAPFVAMCADEYEGAENEYRVTELLKSTRECILLRRHGHEIEADVSDMVWLLFGTAAHGVLEKYTGSGVIKETRISMPIGGRVVTGKPDLYDAELRRVTDYKTASVWKIIYGDHADWKSQLLTYAVMLNHNGFPCDNAQIVALLKDHSKRDAKFKSGYPKLPVCKISFAFAPDILAAGLEWMEQRVGERVAAETLPDDALPMCTPDERYNSGDKYAVMKKGRKTALRVLDSEGAAEEWKGANGGDFIEVRKGEDKKCMDYCYAAPFCSYWRENYENTQPEPDCG